MHTPLALHTAKPQRQRDGMRKHMQPQISESQSQLTTEVIHNSSTSLLIFQLKSPFLITEREPRDTVPNESHPLMVLWRTECGITEMTVAARSNILLTELRVLVLSFQNREGPAMTHSLMWNESVLTRYFCANTDQPSQGLWSWKWCLGVLFQYSWSHQNDCFLLIVDSASSGWEMAWKSCITFM